MAPSPSPLVVRSQRNGKHDPERKSSPSSRIRSQWDRERSHSKESSQVPRVRPLDGRSESGFRLASSFWDRLRGLRCRDGQGVLLLAPCSSVHSLWMAAPIDVAFIDAQGAVLAVHRALAPRRFRSCRGAIATLERYAQPGSWLQPGDVLFPEVLRPPITPVHGTLRRKDIRR